MKRAFPLLLLQPPVPGTDFSPPCVCPWAGGLTCAAPPGNCRALCKFDIRLSHIHPDDQHAIEEIMLVRAERLERTKILA